MRCGLLCSHIGFPFLNRVDTPEDSRNVPVGHSWRPVDDLPEDWQRRVDSDPHRLAEYWHENRDRLDAGHAGYIDALELADTGDLRPLARLFSDIQRRAFEGAITNRPGGNRRAGVTGYLGP